MIIDSDLTIDDRIQQVLQSKQYLQLRCNYLEKRVLYSESSDPYQKEINRVEMEKALGEMIIGRENLMWYGTTDRTKIESLKKSLSMIDQSELNYVEVNIPNDVEYYGYGGVWDKLTYFKCDNVVELPSIAFSVVTGIVNRYEVWYYKRSDGVGGWNVLNQKPTDIFKVNSDNRKVKIAINYL